MTSPPTVETTQVAPIRTPHLARWHRLRLTETDASDLVSAACYRLTENVSIGAVIISELKLSNVQWHIFAADLVEAADNAAFEDAPEALNRVRMHRADDVLASGMMRSLMRVLGQSAVNPAFVGCEQADLIGHD